MRRHILLPAVLAFGLSGAGWSSPGLEANAQPGFGPAALGSGRASDAAEPAAGAQSGGAQSGEAQPDDAQSDDTQPGEVLPSEVLQTAQAWLDRGRPGRALMALDAAPGPADAARLQLEWQAASAARDYGRLLDSARGVVGQPIEGLNAPLAPFWAAHAALWLRRTSAASSALLALEASLEGLDEAERATWAPTVEQYRDQVAEAQAAEERTSAAVDRARLTALALLGATFLALLAGLRR